VPKKISVFVSTAINDFGATIVDSPMTRIAKALAAASALFAVLANGACSNATVPLQAVEYDVPHKFIGKNGKAARDLSGIACAPGQGVRHCLVVDDEGDSAQRATLDGTSFAAGDPVPLVGESEGDVTFGTLLEVGCPNGDGKFGELDGEAVAFAAPYYYVVGSHGCSRKKGEFRASSFILARLSNEQQGSVETTFRLADVLRHASTVSTYFGKDLDSENGLNIEGLAVSGDQLIIGLRGPSIDGRAFLVRTDIDPLFAKGDGPGAPSSTPIPISVPEGTGVRDLTTLADGRLLLLLGPAQEQGLPYRLARIELPSSPDFDVPIKVETLAELPESAVDDTVGKAEAIVVLNETAAELELLVLFDGLKNGAPRKFRILLH
jgi:hypothetical protein